MLSTRLVDTNGRHEDRLRGVGDKIDHTAGDFERQRHRMQENAPHGSKLVREARQRTKQANMTLAKTYMIMDLTGHTGAQQLD